MSLLSGAPLLLGSLACLFGGLLTDAFIRRTGDRKWGRRLFGALGHGICALCYCLCLATSSAWLFVLCLALASFCNDLTMGAAWASCIDIGRHCHRLDCAIVSHPRLDDQYPSFCPRLRDGHDFVAVLRRHQTAGSRSVGWVERSETHHSPLVGRAQRDPPYTLLSSAAGTGKPR